MSLFHPGVIPTPAHVDRLFAEDYMLNKSTSVIYADYSKASFPMYMNDTIGDCTCAGIGHVFGACSYYQDQQKEVIFPDQTILKLYEEVSGYVPGDPSTDVGATLEGVLRYVYQNGLGDQKIVAYAQVGNMTTEGISQALAAYDSVYCAVNLPETAENQFNAGLPWTYVPGSAIAGGHCITLQRITRDEPNCLGFATWGAVQSASQQWWAHYRMEAWAVKVNDTPTTSVHMPALLNDMTVVHG